MTETKISSPGSRTNQPDNTQSWSAVVVAFPIEATAPLAGCEAQMLHVNDTDVVTWTRLSLTRTTVPCGTVYTAVYVEADAT